MDPLAILKDFVQSSQLEQVVVDEGAGRVLFADKYSFPTDTPTAFRARAGTGDFYPLLAVAFFIKTIAQGGIPAYIQTVSSLKHATIEVADRRSLQDYLYGRISSCPHLADVVPTVPLEPVAKKQKAAEPEAGEAAALQHLFNHERQLRDRNSLLCAPGASFRSVLDMVDKVLAARKQTDAAGRPGARGAAPAPASRPQAAAGRGPAPQGAQQPKQMQFMKSSARMERQVDVKGTLKALGADPSIAAAVGLGYGAINAGGSSAGGAGGAAAAAAAGGQPPPGGSSGRGAAPGAAKPASGSKRGRGSGGADAAAAAAAGAAGGGGAQPAGGSGLTPIILVPSALTALINMYNARQFLEAGTFVRSEDVMRDNPVKPSGVVEFTRTARRTGPRFPRYQVTDKVPAPGHPDWKRVVAVIVQGKPWQFKTFPFKGADKGDMMATFNKLFGAYLHYTDERVPDNVQSWKVTKLPLRRTGRHLDHTVMMEFYEKLDAFLQAQRRSDVAF